MPFEQEKAAMANTSSRDAHTLFRRIFALH